MNSINKPSREEEENTAMLSRPSKLIDWENN